ncbi:xylose isomerase [Rhizobium sp. YS-1r]|nr:xylose isomerase [Rhizobium sp. YS-1r]
MAIAFGLNHMAAPRLPLGSFFDLAKRLGISAVEIRNDLPGRAILDGTPPADVKATAEERNLSILSINALQRFNKWNGEREAETRALACYAEACGAKALVLVPVNDGHSHAGKDRLGDLRIALRQLRPLLDDAGLIGLVEPLGFVGCSLRSKREAADTIGELGFERTFRLVHDTFHHMLAGEADFFPQLTGLVHISGVIDRKRPVGGLRDSHRVLVDAGDRLDNLGQIRTLLHGGYEGSFSFEPFAEEVHQLDDPAAALRASMDFMSLHLQSPRERLAFQEADPAALREGTGHGVDAALDPQAVVKMDQMRSFTPDRR